MKKLNLWFCYLLLSYFTILTSSCSKNNGDNSNIIIDNGKIALGFDKNNGSLSVFRDIQNSHDWFDTTSVTGSPWEIEFTKDGVSELIDFSSATKFSSSKPDPATIVLKWKKFNKPEISKLEVEAKISLDKDKALSYWNISVRNYDGKLLKQVLFPRIAGLKEGGNEYLAVPQWMGQIMKDIHYLPL